jgi:hypothetical protein
MSLPARGQSPVPDATQLFLSHEAPVAAVDGIISMRAQRVTKWAEGDVRRYLLEGGAGITIGSSNFEARKAVAWLRTLQGEPNDRVQVFMYLIEPGAPDDASGAVQWEGPSLPIRAIIRAPGAESVQGEVMREQPPKAGRAELVDASAALRKAWTSDARAREEESLPRFTPSPAHTEGARVRANLKRDSSTQAAPPTREAAAPKKSQEVRNPSQLPGLMGLRRARTQRAAPTDPSPPPPPPPPEP